jgi:hypothetical protein
MLGRILTTKPAEPFRQTDIGDAVKDCLALLRHDPAVNELHEFDFVPPDKPLMIQCRRSTGQADILEPLSEFGSGNAKWRAIVC